jgi:MSHA biogenesis protein MshI
MKITGFLSKLFNRSSQRVGWFAICINASGVHFAHVRQAGAKPQVLVCTSFYPAGIVTPPILEKLRKEARIGDFQFTTLLLPGEYQMLPLDAPNVQPDEMKAAIRWRIKDSLNYLVDDATIDVLKVPANKASVERPQSLYAVAVPNNTIRKLESLFERAKIDLNVIDIPEMAQRNIAALFEEGDQGLALLAFDDSGGLLTFTCEGELFLARRIEISLGQLQDTDENMRRQHLDRLELELQRSMDYFGRQYSYIALSRLLVSAPEELGLVALFAPNLDVPVEQLDLAQVMDIKAVPELANSEYAMRALLPLGAALRNEKRVL